MRQDSILARTFKTVACKMHKSLGQRGLVKTVARCITVPLHYGHRTVRELSPSRRRLRRLEEKFDLQFGVDTRQDNDWGWMADIPSPNLMFGAGYEPAPTEQVLATLRDLDINYEEFVFIDFGSGKGKSLFLAAFFPFKSIIGVEYSSRLHEIAERNITTYSNPAQKCRNIRGVLEDAACFPIPEEPAVLFFNHPFDEPVFRRVVDSIEESFAKAPRKLIVIYYDPQCMQLFEANDIFQELTRNADEHVVYETHEYSVETGSVIHE